MKNKALNTLRYTGIVTISKNIGSRKVKIAQRHNTGAYSLFNFLSDCLKGSFELAKPARPTKIMLVERNMSTNSITGLVEYNYTKASDFIFLLSEPEKIHETNQSRVRYSFVIPRDYLEGIDSFDNLGLGLYANGANDAADFAAFCKLDLNQNAFAGASLTVDWELVISNIGSAI